MAADEPPPTEPAVPRPDYSRAIADLARRIQEIEQVSLRPPPPSGATPTPVPPSRPSMASRAASGTKTASVWVLVGFGALTLVAQLAAIRYPTQAGPIVAALQALLAATKGGP